MKKFLVALFLTVALCLSFVACAKEETLVLHFVVDGERYQDNVYYEAGDVRDPVHEPEKEGYTFNGWYYDKGAWEHIFSPTVFNREFQAGEYTLHARFEPFAFTLNEDKVSYTLTEVFDTAVGDVVIPSRYLDKPVTAIATGAFSGRANITSVTIPDSVISIGADAFSNCDGLTRISLPSGVKAIGGRAFADCDKLSYASIGSVVTSVAPSAFENCVALEEVVLPRSVKRIEEKAFKGCAALSKITVSALTESIGDSAFENCTSLGAVSLSKRITRIGAFAFRGASHAKITLADTEAFVNIGESAFASVHSVSFGKGVAFIGKGAFAGVSDEIRFNGTQSELEAIVALPQNNAWSEGCTHNIICSDGELSVH